MLEHKGLMAGRRLKGARVYDAAGRGETALSRPAADEGAEVRDNLGLSNTLTIVLVSALVLGFVFGLVFLATLI